MQQKKAILQKDRMGHIIKVTVMVSEGFRIPKYSSKYGNQLYDDHLKIGLLILKQNLDVSYRELCSMLFSLRIRNGRVHDHSTLVKFSKILDALLPD